VVVIVVVVVVVVVVVFVVVVAGIVVGVVVVSVSVVGDFVVVSVCVVVVVVVVAVPPRTSDALSFVLCSLYNCLHVAHDDVSLCSPMMVCMCGAELKHRVTLPRGSSHMN
jgi:hypothetical protein